MAKRKSEIPLEIGPFKKVEIVSGTDVPAIYTNNVNVELTTFDIRMRIGQIQGASPEGNLQIKDVAYLFMSHQHFLAFVGVLNQTAEKVRQVQIETGARMAADGETR